MRGTKILGNYVSICAFSAIPLTPPFANLNTESMGYGETLVSPKIETMKAVIKMEVHN